jgi:hypothetical protein
MDNLNVYCIPGLGVNRHLFENLKLNKCNLIFIDWISPLKKESLPHYALRLSQQIDVSKPFALIGVSFGGMCAIEISKKISPVKTFLISSSKTKTELPKSLSVLWALPIHHLIGDRVYIKFAKRFQSVFGVNEKNSARFKEALKGVPPFFFARAIDMMVRWKNKNYPDGIIQFHGSRDRVIPYRGKIKYSYTLDKGSHIMILDRGKEISEMINKELEDSN